VRDQDCEVFHGPVTFRLYPLVALTPPQGLFVCAKDLFMGAMVDRRQETVVEGQTERGPGQRGMKAKASS
jgi:hypothetical protein